MLNQDTYRKWTEVFSPGSYYEGTWEEGSKILFLGPNEDGKGTSGMVSRIKENRLHEYISIEHLGIVSDGLEDTTSEVAKKWAPAFENYTFKEDDGVTTLSIDMDIEEEHKNSFEVIWPKALVILKALSEGA